MTIKHIRLLLILLLVFATNSYGQSKVTIPSTFVETKPPKAWDEEWYALNNAQKEFGVAIVDEKLVINKAKRIRKKELVIAGGTLIGIDKGEWGGQLIFKPTDTTKKEIEIKRGNIKFIVRFKGSIYFIEGLAHMGTSYGAIFKLDTTNNHFTFTKVIDFDDAPEAFTIYKDQFLIATHKNFYIVQDFKEELIFKDTFWNGLYPNSIAALDDNNVFIGMRSGIVKLDLTRKTLIFYKSKKL